MKGSDMGDKAVAISMRGITKRFGSLVANSKVDLDVYQGEILSLLGENGSGKTTLMNMLSGIYFPDEGQIYINGEPVIIKSPKDAFSLGIGMVHQHFKLVDVLTAIENIELGLDEKLDIAKAKEKIDEIMKQINFNIDPNEKIYNMTVSQKQQVEIMKVIYRGAKIIILDEPTAVLTPQETEELFAMLRLLKKQGNTIIIITHKLNEVMAISDRVAILRKGEYVGVLETAKTNPQEMTDMMVGHSVTLNIDRPEPNNPRKRIEVRNLTVKSIDGVTKLDNVSFYADSGSVLGIAGISGSGQKELLEAIAGLQPVESGSIVYINDDGSETELIGLDPKKISNMGVALSFVPEDRLGMGLVGNMDIINNMMLRSFREGNSLFLNRRNPKKLAEEVVDELGVKTPGLDTAVRKLSGGNVQKVLVGREISSAPTVLMTAYAVRGLDINSSYMIYDLINEQKKKGVAVIYVGEDLDVLLELSDNIVVLCDGKLSGVVDSRTVDKNKVGMMMTQLEKEEA